jgi:hypothetical protein
MKKKLDKSEKEGYIKDVESKDMLKYEWEPKQGDRERPEWLWRYIMGLSYQRS